MRTHIMARRPMAARPMRRALDSGQYESTSKLHHAAINRSRLLREKLVLEKRLKEVDAELKRSDVLFGKMIGSVERQVAREKRTRKGSKKRDDECRDAGKMELEF